MIHVAVQLALFGTHIAYRGAELANSAGQFAATCHVARGHAANLGTVEI
jgi:hypothetical protein